MKSNRSVGVDGCRRGWLCVFREGQGLNYRIAESIDELTALYPSETIAIDVPIGLPDAGPRSVDVLARRRLQGRRSSVFPAPIRPILRATDRATASDISEAVDGRRISAQAWAIVPKIVEVDLVLQRTPALRHRVHECHPEVCWAGMNDDTPMQFGKKRQSGRRERLALVERYFGRPGCNLYEEIGAQHRRCDVALDDVLDALACLWTAERIASGQAIHLLPEQEMDSLGIPMQMAC
ncbi:MAG: DUF429 domain-containing protein [Planctomycetota bacterium]|jgi:predicted RNase H-like nuclease